MTERSDDVIEESGTIEYWDSLGLGDRTEASMVEKAYSRILEALKKMLGNN